MFSALRSCSGASRVAKPIISLQKLQEATQKLVPACHLTRSSIPAETGRACALINQATEANACLAILKICKDQACT